MNTRFNKIIIGLLCLVGLVSCGNNNAKYQAKLQEEYQRNISEALPSIQGRFDYLKEIYDGIGENTDCVEYKNVDGLSSEEIRMFSQLLPEEDTPNITFTNNMKYVILHIASKNAAAIGMGWWNRVFGAGEGSYLSLVNKTIETESMKEQCLSAFNEDIVTPLRSMKYLLVVTDKIFVRPGVNPRTFDGGYVLSHVDVYDVDTKGVVDSFDVAADNSEKVRLTMEDDNIFIDAVKALPELNNNLRRRLINNIYYKVQERRVE